MVMSVTVLTYVSDACALRRSSCCRVSDFMPADYPGQPGYFQPRNLMEFPRAENTVDLVGFVRIGCELASPRDCRPQSLVSEIAPVCVELVESGDLRPQYFFDGVSLLKHLHSSVNTRVVRPAAPRGELLSDQSQNRGLDV